MIGRSGDRKGKTNTLPRVRRGSAASLRWDCLRSAELCNGRRLCYGPQICLNISVGGLRSERFIGHMHVAGFTVQSCCRRHNFGRLTKTARYQTYVQIVSVDNDYIACDIRIDSDG